MFSSEIRPGMKLSPDGDYQSGESDSSDNVESGAFLMSDKSVIVMFKDNEVVTNDIMDEVLIQAARVLEESNTGNNFPYLMINISNVKNGDFRVSSTKMRHRTGYKVTLEGRLFTEILVVTKDPYVVNFFGVLRAGNLARVAIFQTTQQAFDYLQKGKKM